MSIEKGYWSVVRGVSTPIMANKRHGENGGHEQDDEAKTDTNDGMRVDGRSEGISQ